MGLATLSHLTDEQHAIGSSISFVKTEQQGSHSVLLRRQKAIQD
jgi:hypothetical protein